MTSRSSTDKIATTPETRHERRYRPDGGRRHDRQVLVVGDSSTAVATAGFLEQAGLDPVLAPLPGGRMQPSTLTLWQPALVLLERLGLRRPIEDVGTSLDRLDCPSAGLSWRTEPADRPSLLAVRRSDFADLLDRRVRNRIRTTDRPVTGLERARGRVDVTFEDGIEESFDTVVAADPTLVSAFESPHGTPSLHTWAFDWPPGTEIPEAPTERWGDDQAAFSVPVGDDTRIRLVSTTDPTHAVTDVDALEHRFGSLFDSSVAPFEDVSQHSILYHQFPRAVPASIHADGIVLVGPATRASLPGDCLRTTLAIEAGWVLADELAYGSRDRDDALNAYERRRRRRERTIQQYSTADASTARVPDHLSPLLSQLCVSRTLAFRHVTDGRLPDVAAAIPQSL